MRSDYTHVTYVLDNSGSMLSRQHDTINAYNEFIERQKVDPGKTTFSLYQFNNNDKASHVSVEKETGYFGSRVITQKAIWPERLLTTYEFSDVKEVKNLNTESYKPWTNTPLLDVVGRAVERTGELLKRMNEADRPSKVIIMIQTDGEENASHHFKVEQIKSMIEHQQTKYNWAFTFLGANINAIRVGTLMGINQAATINYSTAKMSDTFDVMGNRLRAYKMGASYAYTNEDRTKTV